MRPLEHAARELAEMISSCPRMVRLPVNLVGFVREARKCYDRDEHLVAHASLMMSRCRVEVVAADGTFRPLTEGECAAAVEGALAELGARE